MKKVIQILILALLLPVQAMAADQWVEGTHYDVISATATETPEIAEYFSFWCPNCYSLKPVVEKINEKKGQSTNYVKVHLNLMPSISVEVQDMTTGAMLVARKFNKESEASMALFNHIHRERKRIATKDDLRWIFAEIGISAAEFDKAYTSFAVNSQRSRNNMLVNKNIKHLSGVPVFIVNGKYKAKFSREVNADQMVDLVVWLSEQK